MSDAMVRARRMLEERAIELRSELVEVERAMAVLAGESAWSSRAAAPARRRRASSPQGPRRSRVERERELIAYAKRHPEASNRSIAKALGVTPPYITRLMRSLGESGRVRRRSGRLIVTEGSTD